jgi:hypothetical protein
MSIDQLLTIASYAKIGNELDALNSTSWIATSLEKPSAYPSSIARCLD